ncbi:helix-turn-helix transcriptional regulator [Micromonospora sp. NPDC092111]|uniref:helix-turn-helix transcriptional regulator n=1 Tax=Micromonospora sp. NPDC092111 TaxID=3364289 RepID=UPI003810CCC3
MDKAIEQAVYRVIKSMKESLGEPLTIDDLARTALFSKFHFSRLFQRVTGVSPGKFLSAMRLQEAKQLLVSTSLNVIDISHLVGYNSVGTFSTRFTSSVGVSPTAYRRYGGFVPQIAVENQSDAARSPSATVGGVISSTPDAPLGHTFIGLFPQQIPQGRPVSCTVLERPGPYLLDKVPEGSWFLLVHALPPGVVDEPSARGVRPYVLRHGPIQVHDDDDIALPELVLRPLRLLDPPVLLALQDIRSTARRIVEARVRAEGHGFDPSAPVEPSAGKPERGGNGGHRGTATRAPGNAARAA